MKIDAWEIPGKEAFVAWLQAKGDDPAGFDVNDGSKCWLTQWLRELSGNASLTVNIDSIIQPGKPQIDTPEWMFNFQANCIYAPGWSMHTSVSGYRTVNSPNKRESTEFTAKAALEVLLGV